MKKFILSLFVLIMAISVTVVYAEETTGNIVSLHEDAYSSVNDITWTSHTNNLFDYMTVSVDSEGNYVLTQTKTSGTDKSLQLAVTRPVGEVVIAKDDVNRTEVVTNNLNGKYVFEFDIESLVKQYPNTTAPYYAIELYSGTSSVIIVRIRANSLDVLDNSSQASATYKYSVAHSSASPEPAEFNLKLEIDTVNKTLSSYYNDKLISSKTNCPIAVGKPVDTIRFFGLSRIDEGSYVKIKNFKITQKERATNATLSSLPEKLVNDVERVTETSVTLPVIEGVTWASADTSAATINGNTLNFNIPETGTKEAVVTATFAQDGYEYTKTYKMTMEKEVVYEFSYTVSDGQVIITDLPSDFAGSVVIPDTIDGYPVTSIGNYAFDGCTSLTEITIPNSVTTIGSYAFRGCTGLTEITIPNSVTSIGNDAFYGCTSLTKVNITDLKTWCGITFGDYSANPFGYAENLYVNNTLVTKLVIPDGVTSIGNYAFYGCASLTEITIPDSVTSIGKYAFEGCTGLTEVTIPDSVTSIENSAFYGCTGLTEVTIPDSVTSIENSAFYGCTGLTEITIPNSVTSIGNYAFRGCTGLTEITIPDSVTSIGNYTFYNCTGLTEITIPDSVTSIGKYAFEGCTGLTEVTIPDSVTSIENSAFYGCTGLTEVTIGNSVTSIGGSAFYGCTGLTEITIGNSVTSIGRYAFDGCTGLTAITIGNGVTSIGSNAFRGCTGLTAITIGNGVTSIGSNAFRGCTGLTKVNITDLKAWCGITFETSDANPLYYAENLYVNNTLITKLVIPEGVTSIGNYAFRYCTGLTEITIPDSVTSIGSSAFAYCTSLTEVIIPEGVTSIGGSVFFGCSGLIEITIPASITSYGGNVLDECENLEIIWYNTINSDYVFVSYLATVYGGDLLRKKNGTFGENFIWNFSDGVLIISGSGDMTWTSDSRAPWVDSSGKIAKVVIPEGVTSIGNYAFYGCTSLTDITIPNSVTSIGSSAFSGCTKLTDITIPNSVTSIGMSAFENCTSLTEVTIPEGVTSIGNYAFRDCRSLTKVTIPNSVTSIGYRVFEDCFNLELVLYLGNEEQWNSVSDNGDIDVLVCRDGYCGENLTWDYNDGVLTIRGSGEMANWTSSSKSPWYGARNVLTKVIISEGVTSIGNCAFYGCTSLTEITIPDSVTSIGNSAFDGCTSLTEITIPDSVTSIGDSAFYGCTGLTEITIPNSVTSIGSNAFRGCTSLTDVTIPNSVTSIGSYAFRDCRSLTKVNITDLKAWCGITFETSDANPLYYAGNLYVNNTIVTELVIPEGVKSIGNYAFYGCNSFRAVIIPNSLTSIGRYAFEYCSNLKTTWYLGSKEQWDNVSVGSNNSALTNAVVYKGEPCGENLEWAYSDGVLTISGSGKMNDWSSSSNVPWYKGCESITNVIIEDGVTSIGRYAFYGCTGLTEVTIPDSVTSIGYCAFEGCTSLTEITIPNSVTSIGEGAFYNTAYYNNSEIWENGVLYIGKHLIKANEEIAGAYNIKEGTLAIVDSAFENCELLTEITIPGSVTSIGSSAFYGCTGLVKTNISDLKAWCGIIFADNPIYYSKNLYLNSELITELVLPDTITTINNSAFANCKSLTKVVIPDSVTHIGNWAFAGCTGLEEITLPFVGTEQSPESPYLSVLGIIFGGEDDCYTANQQISSQETRSYLIPNSLKRVTITNQEVIPYGAFSGCIGLEEVVLSEKVEELSTNAFLNCDKLELVTFYNKDTKIARTNFVGCDITKISSYTGSTAEKFADAYLYEFIPLSEATSEYTITHKNLVSGASSITLDVCVTSPEKMGGKIYVALYDDNHMIQVKVYDAEEIVNATLDFAKGTYIKVMWWDNDHKPIVENLKIDL